MFSLWKISATDLFFKYEFCIHKALETNPVLVELGSEGNAFDGSPSRHLPYNSKPVPDSYLLFQGKTFTKNKTRSLMLSMEVIGDDGKVGFPMVN